MRIRKTSLNFDWYLFSVVLLLVIFGILMIFDASSISSLTEFGNKYYYIKDQLKGVVLGIFGFFFASMFNYRRYYQLALPLLLFCLVLLILVFIPAFGIQALGAHRWIDFRIFRLQPSEVTKLATIMYLAAWLSQKEKDRLTAFLLLMGFVVGLIMLEPDMGTSFIIVSVGLVIYFISGAPLKHFIAIIPLVFTAVTAFAIAAPYRFNRIMTFLNPSGDPLGASYHVRQILIALGNGGLWGLGFGKSRQKFFYLPEASTDSIFAIIAEELGFIGATFLIIVFITLLYRGYLISKRAPDTFGRFLAFGIVSWFALQIIINLSSMVILTPLTGVPLPFISYGSSSLVVVLYATGILVNIRRHSRL